MSLTKENKCSALTLQTWRNDLTYLQLNLRVSLLTLSAARALRQKERNQ